ncbi:MAG: Yip1 family protein [Usitatibacter sp.]
MRLIDRAKNILLSPKTEWDAIAADSTATGALITGYVLPLAAASAIAGFIGMTFVGIMGIRIGLVAGLAGLVIHLVLAVVSVFVVGFIIDALAPTFGGQKNMAQAVKMAAYTYTPVWVVGILGIIPALRILGLIAALYAIYLLYLGLPRLMKSPPEKSAGYTAVVIIVAIVLSLIIGAITAAVTTAMSPALVMGRSGITYDRDSKLGKLNELGKKMEEAGKRMETAQKSGDPNKQMEAAMGVLGTALSGGKGVDPVSVDKLKPFLPATVAGLPQTDQRGERSGVTGLMVAKAEATYGEANGPRRIDLEVVDTGGAAGLLGLASWIGVQGEREDSNRRLSTRKEGNRMIHEEVDKRGGRSKYTVVVGDRFVASAQGSGVDIDTLRSAVGSIDLGKLEALQ